MVLDSDVDLALTDPHRVSVPPAVIGAPGRAYAEVRPLLRTDPAQPPDTTVDHGAVGDLEVRAAAVRGLSHRQNGSPRQDAYGFTVTADQEWLVAVVADGVSAGRLSHEAASFVARRGPRAVAAHLDDGVPVDGLPWHDVFTALAATIIAEGRRSLLRVSTARHSAEPPTDAEVAEAMATTATFLVCETAMRRDGRRRVEVAWMGDSPAWLMSPDGCWRSLSVIKVTARRSAVPG
jgi:serine/threonine protein phosphatase PrpC